MNEEDKCHPCDGKVKKVYIDGSPFKVGASNYSGWGIWTPDEQNFNDNGPLKGKQQSSDRAEVRVLVAALEKYEQQICHYRQSICQRHRS
eukprot:13175316-Heterocapsa_arctica.AAC.1